MGKAWRAHAVTAALLFAGASAARAGGGPTAWERQVEEAKEVSALSDRIHATKVMISQWRRVHEKAQAYHEHQSKLIKTQISIRKRQRKAMENQLLDYKAAQEERYKNKMCMLLMRAFHLGGEQAAKVKILKDLRGKLGELEDLLEQIRAEYRRDKAGWASERTELSRVESELGDEVVSLHSQKQAVASAAAKKMQEAFCPVVKANYGVSEETIQKHITSECQ